ncbi:MAG: hypothetical protein CM1200mP22_22150 [Dehalococcoidia bacterium]|nr:MAG: hypothetical protein CM1200mP22_22150 [Dehalococcoidia bacterium]
MAPALGQKNFPRIGPWLSFRLQSGLSSPSGAATPQRHRLPPHWRPGRRGSGLQDSRPVSPIDVEAMRLVMVRLAARQGAFLKTLELDSNIDIFMVNENGASVYSAPEVARNEFPDHDLTVRGTVSIGRRLMDPLSELVKIDPKSIGVGKYQHDVDQKSLKERLDEVVGSCVNNVGVELNTASAELLSYVSGLGPKLANAIVKYRKENGPFSNREPLKECTSTWTQSV